MNNNSYLIPLSEKNILDIINHSVYFSFDKMQDDSWRRQTSEYPLEWIWQNLDKVTMSLLSVKYHHLNELDEKWRDKKHLELIIELRKDQSTYILTCEINFRYLDYFIKEYNLNPA